MSNVKPNFFMVGAPKCGTTAWATFLRTHPDVSFGVEKEPHYFGQDLRWKRQTTLSHYLGCYAGLEDVPVVGDGSVLYLYSERAAGEIRAYNPAAKILIMLRDHASFLRSYHNEMLYHGVEVVEDLETAWALSDRRREGHDLPAACPDPRLLDYPAVARFLPQVERFYDQFPAAQINVLWQDDWKNDPRPVYLEMMDYLGLADDGRVNFPVVSSAKSHRIGALKALFRDGPPASLVRLFSRVKALLGIKRRTYLFKQVKLLNTRHAQSKAISPALETEIRARFADDRPAIEALIRDRTASGTAPA